MLENNNSKFIANDEILKNKNRLKGILEDYKLFH